MDKSFKLINEVVTVVTFAVSAALIVIVLSQQFQVLGQALLERWH